MQIEVSEVCQDFHYSHPMQNVNFLALTTSSSSRDFLFSSTLIALFLSSSPKASSILTSVVARGLRSVSYLAVRISLRAKALPNTRTKNGPPSLKCLLFKTRDTNDILNHLPQCLTTSSEMKSHRSIIHYRIEGVVSTERHWSS